MQGNALVAHARKQFAKHHGNPAPFYLYVLQHAQAHAMRNTRAVASGCAGMPGGSTYVQRYTAQHKQVHRAPANHAHVPTASRAAWVTVQVPVTRMVRGVPVRKLVTVTNRKQVATVPAPWGMGY